MSFKQLKDSLLSLSIGMVAENSCTSKHDAKNRKRGRAKKLKDGIPSKRAALGPRPMSSDGEDK